MKIQTLTMAALLAFSCAASASTLNVNNDSKDANAVGGNITANDTPWGNATGEGGAALAGSVVIESCDCFEVINVNNKSDGANAISGGIAGSVVVQDGYVHMY